MRSLLAVVAVWMAGYGYGEVSGDFVHWQFNILTDFAAGWIIMRHPAMRLQAALGGTFFVQVAMHGAYGVRETWGIPDPVAYYDMLTIVAYAQLAILGGWCVGLWGESAIHRFRHRRGALAGWKGNRGVGGKA